MAVSADRGEKERKGDQRREGINQNLPSREKVAKIKFVSCTTMRVGRGGKRLRRKEQEKGTTKGK